MRVLVGPFGNRKQDAGCVEAAEEAARALAAPGGSVVSLPEIGVGNLSRRLSAAEVDVLRRAMSSRDTGDDELVGYVCKGRALPSFGPLGEDKKESSLGLVAVTDHANLTWRSPLTGPNDEAVGPRFPSMTGVYVPDVAVGRLSTTKGMIVRTGTVAGVCDQDHLNAFELQMVEAHGFTAASSELVPVVIVAAHMGLRVAALVVVPRCEK